MYGYWAHYMLSGDYRKVKPIVFTNNESNLVGKFIANTVVGGLCGHMFQYSMYFVGINVTNNMMPGAMHFDMASIYKEMFRVKERRITAGIVVVGAIIGNVSNVCKVR
jgi:hypothetical protein